MKQCTTAAGTASVQECWKRQSRTRFPDWHNLPKPRWRDALRALAAPAERMHKYRNLRTAIVHHSISELDRKDCS